MSVILRPALLVMALSVSASLMAATKTTDLSPTLITVTGPCTNGATVKASANDSTNYSSAIVSVKCASSKYSLKVDSTNLRAGKLSLSVREEVTTADPVPPTTGYPDRPQKMVKIMPLGDSITHGYTVLGGYRTRLYDYLMGPLYYDHFNLVGTQNDGPGNLPDKDHQGHPGFRIDQIDVNINAGMDANMPDVVLLHIGSNDILQNYNVSTAPARTMALIDKIRAKNPNVLIFVAKIFPANDAVLTAKVNTYNSALNSLVLAREAQGQKIHMVDQNSGFNPAVDTSDAVHPTQAAYNLMADRWFAAIQQYID